MGGVLYSTSDVLVARLGFFANPKRAAKNKNVLARLQKAGRKKQLRVVVVERRKLQIAILNIDYLRRSYLHIF